MASVAVQNLPCNFMDVGPGPVLLSGGLPAGVVSYPPQHQLQHLQRPNQQPPIAQGFLSSSQGRPGDKRKRPWTKKRKQQPGSQLHHPSQLSKLAQKNRQRTARHYPQSKQKISWRPGFRCNLGARESTGTNFWARFRAGQETPRTVPHAPFNSNADFILAKQRGKL